MSTPNIVMTRIDERLVHGQGQLWIKSLGVNTVIVANDETAQDAMAQTLMKTGIPKEVLKRDLEHCMRIPMTDGVRALNVSNSVAIVIYEALRQQNYEGLLLTEPSTAQHKGADYLERE